ncbi:MAG: CapA family protein [Saprospiraceae bacterium]|nr:CapA family protein [Saprospiraceae bacterium]
MLKQILSISLYMIAVTGMSSQHLEKVAWSEPGKDADEVVVMFMADMNIQNRVDPASGFRYLMTTLQDADVRFCNLEGPFAGTSDDPNVYDIPHKPAWTHSDPSMVKGLVAAGFDVVGVANNVTFPSAALLRSLQVLDQEKIQHTGGGKNKMEATKPVFIERKGTRIAFVQYACTVFPYDHAASASQPGIAEVKISTSYLPPPNLDKPGQPPLVLTQIDPASLQEMQENIKNAKENADVVIASYHWGVSNELEPHPYQREVARAAIDAGADMIFGHGAHKLQTIETWQEKPIFYCAGNAVFDWWKIRSGLDGLLVRMVIQAKEVKQISFVPLQRDDANDPRLYSVASGTGQKLFDKVASSTDVDRARLIIKNQEAEVYHRDRQEEVPVLKLAWETSGFAKPESAVYDARRDFIYVGNINGDSQKDAFDGDGFISRVHPDGKIEQLKWVTGLNDPKGMDLNEDILWVNDINQVVKIDVSTGEILKRYDIPQAVFLNDISVSPDGMVFSNDADGHQTYWLQGDSFTIFSADVTQGRPNGIWAENDRLLIATSNSHQLLSVDRGDRKPTLLANTIGRGDGIEGLGHGDYFVSDYSGRIFYFSPMQYLYTLVDLRDEHPTADFEFISSKNQLIVPTHKGNTLMGYDVQWSENYGANKVH